MPSLFPLHRFAHSTCRSSVNFCNVWLVITAHNIHLELGTRLALLCILQTAASARLQGQLSKETGRRETQVCEG